MVIAEEHLEIITRTTRAGPATPLVIDRLRPAQNTSMYIINIHESSNDPAWGNVYRLVLSSTCETSYLSFKTSQKKSPPL